MAKVSVEKFLELVKRSGLVDDAPLNQLLRKLHAATDRGQLTAAEPIAEALVRDELLTRWQADNLLQGKHKGFFLGKYKLLRHLGRGGMSNVYVAEHVMMKRRVAIKVLPQNRIEDSSYLERFKLEAQAAAKLDHPNIVRVYDFDADQNAKTYYLVMEFVQGRDLQAMVQDDGPLNYDQAADCIAQAAAGLQHAHEAGLIHRDIKPANCLVDGKGTVKLLDMGLAKFSQDDRPSLTIAHDENVLGTADYLAPEQALNSHSVDRRADIYSLGCTLYYLLTGHPPFPEGTLPQRLMMHQTQSPKSIYLDRSDAPQGLVDICNCMMRKGPDERYQSAASVAQALAEWLASRGKTVSAGPGSSGSGVLTAAAEEASLLMDPTDGNAAPRSPARPAPPRRPAAAPSEELELAPADVSKVHSRKQPLANPEADPSATAGDDAPALAGRPAIIADRPSVPEPELDPNDALLSGGRDADWPSTSVIAERTRRSRSRISPWVWVSAGAGVLLLVGMVLALLW